MFHTQRVDTNYETKGMARKLKFNFNKENLEIELSEKEVNHFSSKPPFLNKEAGEWKIEDSFFEESTKVPDVFRYILKYVKDNTWRFFDPKNEEVGEFSIDKDEKVISSKDSNSIILVLESPHKDEYEICENKLIPRSPASGASGMAIYKLFTSHVLPILINLGLELNEENEYRFCIVNPVPYQTSLVKIHQKGLISSLRNKVWKVMYPKLKDDFKERLKKYQPCVLLNGCTSDLKGVLKTEINQITNCQVFNVNHPASWQRSLSGFKIYKKEKHNNENVTK